MFTGIITDIGRVEAATGAATRRLRIGCGYDLATIPLGASIACDGCCLTVAAKGDGWFEADASPETLARTTIGDWAEARRVNLERPLKVGDELGGHIVSGHVDGVGTVVAVAPQGEGARVEIDAPAALARFIAEKGSIAVDGASLTVNGVDGARFWLTLIPHTLTHTTFADLAPGRRANLEIDMLARYVARLREDI